VILYKKCHNNSNLKEIRHLNTFDIDFSQIGRLLLPVWYYLEKWGRDQLVYKVLIFYKTYFTSDLI